MKLKRMVAIGIVSVMGFGIAAMSPAYAGEQIALRSAYENVITEVIQIKAYIDRGLYLEAQELCRNVLSTRVLSPDDISLINNYKDYAGRCYNDYLSNKARKEPDYGAVLKANGIYNYVYFLPDDYDGDGKREAYVITGDLWIDDVYSYVNIYYISNSGKLEQVMDNTSGLYGGIVDTGAHKYMEWVNYAMGSGASARLYGCKNGKCYEPQISGMYNAVFKGSDGYFYGNENDFSKGYHDYVNVRMIFNNSTLEFVRK